MTLPASHPDARFADLVNSLDGIVWEADAETWQFLFISAQAERILGYPLARWYDDPQFWPSHIHPDDRTWALDYCTSTTARLQPHSFEYRMIAADGRIVWLHDLVTVTAVDGRARTLRGVMVDVTERKQVERALAESEERLRAVVANASTVAIQWYDAEGRVLLWNEGSERLFGFTSEQAIGRTLDELIYTPEQAVAYRHTLDTVGATGVSAGPAEFPFRHRSGESGTCLSTVFRIPGDAHGHWFVCLDVDVTAHKKAEQARRELEAQILHAQKLESLGVLAGGIAHDFNNLLTAVMGNAGAALMQLPADSPVVPMIEEIEHAARRATDLTRQMLAYSGRGRFLIQPVHLEEVVREMTMLLGSVISKKARIDLRLDAATISGDATQVRQIVMNLITNASDALASGQGDIAVRTGVRDLGPDDLRSPYLPVELPAGPYAFLEVRDTGCGMCDETLLRIFDPFFTTKFTGRGLGLATVLGIVRSHQGTLQVTSRVGEGTTFRLFFPAIDTHHESQTDVMPVTPATQVTGTILFVDDEPAVRRLGQLTLQSIGFRVLPAEDGRQGLELFRAHASEITAAVVDLTMPRMDGLELLAHLRAAAPDLPVLLMSGYSENEVSARLAGQEASGFVQKPFPPREFLSTVLAAVTRRI